jgi:hypothetical protein
MLALTLPLVLAEIGWMAMGIRASVGAGADTGQAGNGHF